MKRDVAFAACICRRNRSVWICRTPDRHVFSHNVAAETKTRRVGYTTVELMNMVSLLITTKSRFTFQSAISLKPSMKLTYLETKRSAAGIAGERSSDLQLFVRATTSPIPENRTARNSARYAFNYGGENEQLATRLSWVLKEKNALYNSNHYSKNDTHVTRVYLAFQ